MKAESAVKAHLGINTGFALNRFPRPETWARIVREDLGLRRIQLTADVFGAHHSGDIQQEMVERIRAACGEFDIWVQTAFTGAYTRVNHLMHPDEGIRRFWFDWLKRFFDVAAALGAEGAGSHAGILSVEDERDPERRAERVSCAVGLWQQLSEHAAEAGLDYLIYEPMSIPRELGETIDKAREFREAVQAGSHLPFLYCLDVDHGDVASEDPRDTDPYAWLEKLGAHAPVVHVKQSLTDKGGHYPFTEQYNRQGRVWPEKVLAGLEKGGAKDVTLLLEISHRERMPFDQQVVSDLVESVRFWRPYAEVD